MKIIYQQFLLSLMSLLFFSLSYAAQGDAYEAQVTETTTPNTNPQQMMGAETGATDNKVKVESQALDSTPSVKTQAEMTGFSRGTVVRSLFTTLIDNREPVDKVKQVPEKNGDVFYFTELRDMSGQTAKHRWEYKGKVIAEVNFKVRGPRWRVWSKKSFQPGWAGDWKVSVVNGADEVISEEMIAFTEPTADMIDDNASEKPMNNKLENNPTSPSTPAIE